MMMMFDVRSCLSREAVLGIGGLGPEGLGLAGLRIRLVLWLRVHGVSPVAI